MTKIIRWMKRLETRKILENMTTRELDDIGITRGDIINIVKNI